MPELVSRERPTRDQYEAWVRKLFLQGFSKVIENHYKEAALASLRQFEESQLWRIVRQNWAELGDKYYATRPHQLFAEARPPEPVVKSFQSILDKSFRKNVLSNDKWPDPPEGGWILPPIDWLSRTNDVVRTCIVVKYLDGVEYLCEELQKLAESVGISCEADFEAQETGYYAVHLYPKVIVEVNDLNYQSQEITITPEIQIRTQLQDLVAPLTHPMYVRRRSHVEQSGSLKWQWQYRSLDFKLNYLTHTLHYVDGLMVELVDALAKEGKSD